MFVRAPALPNACGVVISLIRDGFVAAIPCGRTQSEHIPMEPAPTAEPPKPPMTEWGIETSSGAWPPRVEDALPLNRHAKPEPPAPSPDTFAPHGCPAEWIAPNGSCAKCAWRVADLAEAKLLGMQRAAREEGHTVGAVGGAVPAPSPDRIWEPAVRGKTPEEIAKQIADRERTHPAAPSPDLDPLEAQLKVEEGWVRYGDGPGSRQVVNKFVAALRVLKRRHTKVRPEQYIVDPPPDEEFCACGSSWPCKDLAEAAAALRGERE